MAWYRVDKTDGQRAEVTEKQVEHAAEGWYQDTRLVMETGKFQTPFCYYEHEPDA